MTMPQTKSNGQNPFDVFEEGEEIPWGRTTATIVDVDRGYDEYPDENEDVVNFGGPRSRHLPPNRTIAIVTLAVDGSDEDENWGKASSEYVYRELNASFKQFGLPTVECEVGRDDAVNMRLQTPATGDNTLDAHGARDLAEFLRDNADFEPLYALLGNVSSAEDMHALADACEQAARVFDFAQRKDS